MHESLRSDQPDAWRVCRRVAQRQVQRPAEDRADATGMVVAIFRLAVDVAAGRVATHRMRSRVRLRDSGYGWVSRRSSTHYK